MQDVAVQLSGLVDSSGETGTTEEGEYPIGQVGQAQRETMEDNSSGPQETDDKRSSARSCLGHPYLPIQGLYADLIDEYHKYNKSERNDIARWRTIIKNPTPDDVEQVRQAIHWEKSHRGLHNIDTNYEANPESTQKILEYYRGLCGDAKVIDHVRLKIELEGRYSTDEDRTEILYWKRHHMAGFGPEDNGEPEIDAQSRKVFDIDYFEARCTNKEYGEVQARCNPDTIDVRHKIWTEVFRRIHKGVQGSGISTSTDDERRAAIIQPGATETKTDQGTRPEKPREDSNIDRRRIDFRESLEARRINREEPTCCANCLQCSELKQSGEDIEVGGHHRVQVRVAVLQAFDDSDRNDKPYRTFSHCVLSRGHKTSKDKTGLVPYWRQSKFYKDLYKTAKYELSYVWPFHQLSEAGVEWKLSPHSVKFDGYKETKTCKVTQFTKQTTIDDLPQPKHVTRTHEMNKDRPRKVEYDGLFTVYVTVECNADKARMQRIQYADDRLAQRLKQIMTDSRGSYSDLYWIGALLIAFAAYDKDGAKDNMKPQLPPYKKTNLREAMDSQSWKDYNHLIDISRKQRMSQDIMEMICATQQNGASNPTSSTPGPQEATQPMDVDPNGAKTTETKSTRDTSKTPMRTSSNTRYYSKPPVQERLWSRSTRIWTPEPSPRSHTAKVRPQSDGGRESSVAQRRTVFERLETPKKETKPEPPKKITKKKETEDGTAKRSKK